jgi:hypothetical protein
MKKHLAGIIPVSGIRSDFSMPWHASLMPIGPNYLAVERSVLECAYAGCNTIWVICSDDVQPLIRYQIGEKIQDPVYNYRHYEYSKKDFKRPIRVYYIPIDVKDINKRDCLSWSVLHGILTCDKIIKNLSNWLKPDKFYVSWPYGYYNPSIVREHRREISEGLFMLSHNSQTIQDDKYLGFSMTLEQAKQLRSEVREKSTGRWINPETRDKQLPLEERFSYRNFTLSQVFDTLDTSAHKIKELEHYYNIDNWQSYCLFLSENSNLKKPAILKSTEWNEIGKDI